MPKTILKNIFGYTKFRPLQEQIISHTLAKKDCVVLMPTGGGKSLCYQIPALYFEGCTLVVSPLISLMQDQVTNLKQLGINADVINSTLTPQQQAEAFKRLFSGETKLLYVSPERLMLDGFLEKLPPLALIAIDEAHCISEWGHDFRESYRQLNKLKSEFPDVPLMALTATATPRVLTDIQTQLSIPTAPVFKGSFNRENLLYSIRPKANTYNQILNYIKNQPGQSGIIYCQSRKNVDNLAEKLTKDNIKALPYHAGLSTQIRADHQNKFKYSKIDVIVATIAFGMGIDKPDVRYVIHQDIPKSMENYYQETGRAGRDGLPSECILYYSYADSKKYSSFIQQITNPNERKHAEQKLLQMTAFAYKPLCRRKQLLAYFNEHLDTKDCNNCDICLNPPKQWDATIISQKILSCIYRVKERFGAMMIVDILKGSTQQRIQQFGLHKLSVYGIEKELTNQQIRDVIDYLTFTQAICIKGDTYPVLGLTQKAKPILFHDEPVIMPVYTKTKSKTKKHTTIHPSNPELFEKLRKCRLDCAKKQGVPPFMIFSDKSLHDMAAKKPKTMLEFLEIHGVGKVKAKSLGDIFLNLINS